MLTPTPIPAVVPVDKPLSELPVDVDLVVLDVVVTEEDEDEAVDVDTKSVAWNRICTPYALNPSGPVTVEVTIPAPGTLEAYT